MSELELGQIIYVFYKDKIRAAKVCSINSALISVRGDQITMEITVYTDGTFNKLNRDIHTWATTSEEILKSFEQDIIEWKE